MKKIKNSGGFTLVELLVAIVIVTIISGISLASLAGQRERARDARRISELHDIEDAVNLFFLEKGYIPVSIYSEYFDPADPDKDFIEKIFENNIPMDPKTGDHYDYIGYTDTNGKKRYCIRAQLEYVAETTPSCESSASMSAGGYVLQGP